MKRLLVVLGVLLFAVAAEAQGVQPAQDKTGVSTEVYVGYLAPTKGYNNVSFKYGVDVGLNVLYNFHPRVALGGFVEIDYAQNKKEPYLYNYDIKLSGTGYMIGAAAQLNMPISNSLGAFAAAKIGVGQVRPAIEIVDSRGNTVSKANGDSESAKPLILEAGARYYPSANYSSYYTYLSLRYLSFKGKDTDLSGININIGVGF